MSRKHSPFFLTYFRHSHFPFQHLTNRTPNLNENSSVEARINLSRNILREAADHVEAFHSLTKAQFDKNVKIRKFPVGCKVFVKTSQREGMSKKLARPFKGPFSCLEELSNGNIRFVPLNGGQTITIHKNNCKLAPHRFQHLTFDETESDQELPDNDNTISDPFRFSSIDCPTLFDDTHDDAFDNTDRTTPEPEEPPDPNREDPNAPVPGAAAPYPTDPGLRQNDPPGPPRTRAAARAPGQELPALPGIAHDRLPLECMLHKLKKQVNPSDK